jgi:molybdate transport system substrate-binding protein
VIKIISSMATRLLLVDLAKNWQEATGLTAVVESVGGLDAAKRVQAGEVFDGVVLAREAIEKLVSSGHVVPGSRVDLARSSVAVAVKAGEALPDISTEAALRGAVEAATTLGYSTGPSGVAVIELFERWGMTQALKSKIVQTPPGVPVGSLVASGEVALGFQQLSELMHLEGISVVGTLPEPVGITTIFSVATCVSADQPDEWARFAAFAASVEVLSIKRFHGMDTP